MPVETPVSRDASSSHAVEKSVEVAVFMDKMLSRQGARVHRCEGVKIAHNKQPETGP